jgi:hypothetical protein
MSQWATVDRSNGPGLPWKGRVFRATSEEAARAAAHAFGYTVLRRESDNEEWREA